ncbi:MAG TPA: hypothetical protein VEV16_12115, partial [Daejeonella sp.]|nr:hypothetical protein [Daejeonella sp.]
MKRAKNFLSKLIYHKFFWQFFLAILMLGTAAFFIRHEHLELLQISNELKGSSPLYITLGIILTL